MSRLRARLDRIETAAGDDLSAMPVSDLRALVAGRLIAALSAEDEGASDLHRRLAEAIAEGDWTALDVTCGIAGQLGRLAITTPRALADHISAAWVARTTSKERSTCANP